MSGNKVPETPKRAQAKWHSEDPQTVLDMSDEAFEKLMTKYM